jgi:uroporphyrinogen decarboxylase
MKHRERVIQALNHKEPDRVPIDLGGYQTGIMVEAYNRLKRHLGFDSPTEILEPMQQLAVPEEEILTHFDIDTRYIFPRPAHLWKPEHLDDGSSTYYTDFGKQKLIKKSHWHYYEFAEYPLAEADINDLESYPFWPDPDAPARTQGLLQDIESLYNETDYAIVAVLGSAAMEQSWYLCGLERFLIDTIQNLEFIEKLLDKVTDIELKLYENFLDVTGKYLNVIQLWGDFGGQDGPYTSPDFIRNTVLPRDREIIQLIKDKSDAKIMWHSCGSVYEFVPDLIDMGIDILNPVQVSARDMEDTGRLKREFGRDMSFWGAIDTQRVLPLEGPKEVEQEVKKRIDDLSKDGGYIVAAVHNIQDEVPAENIVAMYETAKKYGTYS